MSLHLPSYISHVKWGDKKSPSFGILHGVK